MPNIEEELKFFEKIHESLAADVKDIAPNLHLEWKEKRLYRLSLSELFNEKYNPHLRSLNRIDPKNLGWLPWAWYQITWFSDYIGKRLASFFGITAPEPEIIEPEIIDIKDEERDPYGERFKFGQYMTFLQQREWKKKYG